MQQVFYVTLDPEKALGIEDLLSSYHILCSEPSQMIVPLLDTGIDVKHFPNSENKHIINTAKLLQEKKIQEYINQVSYGKPDVIVFKNDKATEELCHKLEYNLLNPSYKVLYRFENKVEFAKFIDSIELFTQPEHQFFEKFDAVSYTSLSSRFGHEFVVQFFFGHSGNTTFFVSAESELQDLQRRYPLRKGKVTRKINGNAYTINACITRLGVITGGISEQITGIEKLTSSKGGTVGNDYTQRHLTDFLRAELVMKTIELGNLLMKEGHRGIFGLDFVLDEESHTFYLIEANVRQTLSSPFYSYLQREQKQVPIMLWHTLELLNHNYYEKFTSLSEENEEWINESIDAFRLTNNRLDYNIQLNQPLQASQIFFRNIHPYPVKVLDEFPSGVYRIRGRLPVESALLEMGDESYPAVFHMREDGWNTLCFICRGYSILDAKKENGFFIHTLPEQALVPELGEIGRLQIQESAFSSKNTKDVNGWIMDVIDTIYENTRYSKS